MRRRDDGVQPPPELCEFDGIRDGYTTAAAWRAAFNQWEAARREWAAERGVDVADMPAEIGDEPWDPSSI